MIGEILVNIKQGCITDQPQLESISQLPSGSASASPCHDVSMARQYFACAGLLSRLTQMMLVAGRIIQWPACTRCVCFKLYTGLGFGANWFPIGPFGIERCGRHCSGRGRRSACSRNSHATSQNQNSAACFNAVRTCRALDSCQDTLLGEGSDVVLISSLQA